VIVLLHFQRCTEWMRELLDKTLTHVSCVQTMFTDYSVATNCVTCLTLRTGNICEVPAAYL